MSTQTASLTADDLIAYRKSRGWSQLQLAEALHVTQSFVSRLESGEREIDGPLVPLLTRMIADEQRAARRRQAT